MDYVKHYTKLITRAQNRTLDGYKERHHIIPRCIGGSDNKKNLVELTAEEHYVAHLLLLKIYPKEPGLIYAAMMMCCNSENHQRQGNKRYGWLRRKYALAISEIMKIKQAGKKNSQYGTCWIYNIGLKKSRKIPKEELEMWLASGWEKGYVINWKDLFRNCKCCKEEFNKKERGNSIYCSDECRRKYTQKSYEEKRKNYQTPSKSPLFGREEELREKFENIGNVNGALISMNISSTQNFYTAKKILGIEDKFLMKVGEERHYKCNTCGNIVIRKTIKKIKGKIFCSRYCAGKFSRIKK